jgi:hypothetical protein
MLRNIFHFYYRHPLNQALFPGYCFLAAPEYVNLGISPSHLRAALGTSNFIARHSHRMRLLMTTIRADTIAARTGGHLPSHSTRTSPCSSPPTSSVVRFISAAHYNLLNESVLKKVNQLPTGWYIWGGNSASTPYIPHSFMGKYIFQHSP